MLGRDSRDAACVFLLEPGKASDAAPAPSVRSTFRRLICMNSDTIVTPAAVVVSRRSTLSHAGRNFHVENFVVVSMF